MKNRLFTYLITGANRGIGFAFARQLSERGDSVIATAREPDKAPELAKLSVRVETLDVSDEASIEKLSRLLADRPIDVLVNNAAIGESGPALERLRSEDLERTLRVNAVAPVAVTRTLLPNLRAGRRRTVVNITSGLGSISGNEEGGWYAYRASKAALNQLTRTMAAELRRERFICIVICPGWVRTEMGGTGAPISPAESVAAMLRVIDGLKKSDNGRFFDRRGKQVPW